MNFNKIVWDYYRKHRRQLIWREKITPYYVFISEVMLQQTQVSRVEKKFPEFIKKYPDFKSLTQTSTKELLQTWQGMGYNRRALYLRDAAQIIINAHEGKLPQDPIALDELPGIGSATAKSIVVFLWNKPLIFIETNIRRVFIRHFFSDRTDISDEEILLLVEETLDRENPREWYYALMDYGSYLPRITKNPNRRSKHYKKQTLFMGSDRQIRGTVIKLLLNKSLSLYELSQFMKIKKERIKYNIARLEKEGFVMEKKGKYAIK